MTLRIDDCFCRQLLALLRTAGKYVGGVAANIGLTNSFPMDLSPVIPFLTRRDSCHVVAWDDLVSAWSSFALPVCEAAIPRWI